MLQDALQTVAGGAALDSATAEAVMHQIMGGEATPAQIGALLGALRTRGEEATELTGFARAMRRHCRALPIARSPLIDTCGTGGGGRSTLNVSTAAAIVAAGAGATVAKHGNRALTSTCGSADVLTALGIAIDAAPASVAASIEQVGIGFLFAPGYHPAMKHAAGPRREIGIRTVFNLLGPLTNPAGATAQVIGVPEPALVDLLLTVMANLGRTRALVVHGLAGVDEISCEGPTLVSELRDGWVRRSSITPADLGLPEHPLSAVASSDAVGNAARIVAVLEGQPGPDRDFVILNAAAAVLVAGLADEWRSAAAVAAQAIDDGAALACLTAWRRSQGVPAR
ncbi:MAG: anthranilate phosphoribosyltransferase [Fimbriimonadaceae bacterium]|nr:anthranilate phosphoribosyltransferase [Fimbriimonadaceae bacterium]